jgi:hypothetical protein
MESPNAQFTVLGAFRAGFGAVFRHPLQFIAIGLFVSIPMGILFEWLTVHGANSGNKWLDLAYGFWCLFVACVAVALVQTAAACGVGAHLRGESVTLRGCFEAAFIGVSRLLPVIVWVTAPVWVVMPIARAMGSSVHGIPFGLAILLLFLVLPVAAPVATSESLAGYQLFRRAWQLFASARWRALGAILLTLLAALIIDLLLTATVNLGLPALRDSPGVHMGLLYLSWAFTWAPVTAAYHLRLHSDRALESIFD